MASNRNSRLSHANSSEKYATIGTENYIPENGHSYEMDNPLYFNIQTAAGDPYTLNRAYNEQHVSNKPGNDMPISPSRARGVSGKLSAKEERAKKLRQLQFYIVIIIALTIILCLAFGLGFGLGYRDDDIAVTSRIEKEDPNKLPDANISIVIEDIQWDSTMLDIHSSSFKHTADVTERSMDSYFGKSAMAEIYDYAVVSALWQGSVGCFARIYLKPPTANTPSDIRDIYNSIRNGSGEQTLVDNLKMGQDAVLSAPHENKVKFKFGTTTTNRMDSTTTPKTIPTATNTATSPFSGTSTVDSTVEITSSGTTTTRATEEITSSTERGATSTISNTTNTNAGGMYTTPASSEGGIITSSSGTGITTDVTPTLTTPGDIELTTANYSIMKYELVGGDNTTYGYVRVKLDSKDGLLCSPGDHSDAMATYLCRDINSNFYGGSNLEADILHRPAGADLWQVEANCYRPLTDSSFSDCVQSDWKFIQNVTYSSNSMKNDNEQLPYMPDPNICPLNTWYGTTESPDKPTNYIVSETCLVKINCHTQPVAIYQGPFSNSGYIFATNSSDPLIFCRDNFTDLDAIAACNSLGYKNGGMSLKFNPIPWFNSRTWKYNGFDYQCSQNQTIQVCSKTEIDISKLNCSGPAVIKCIDATATDKDWDLKLDSDGRTVLLYYKGQWGTICDAGIKKPWTIKEATIVCQHFGYTSGVPRSLNLTPKISLPHVIANLTCSNSAAKLSDCSYDEISNDMCNNSYAAKVFCYNSSDVANLKLLSGTEFNSGFVKVTWQNIEGYLCTWSLSNTAATVMCRNFGFISGIQDTNPNFTDPHLQYIWQTDFNGQCNTNEVLPEICRSATWVKYSSNLSQADMRCVCNGNYISLYCYGKVKVSLEPRKNYGPLFIYYENDYYSVCYDDLNQNAANAACREVTRLNTSNAVILYPGTFTHINSKDVEFVCAEDAISVTDCATILSGFNFDCQVGSVLCYEGQETPGPTPENATEWRIESSVVQVKAYGLWGTICSDGWTNNEATIFCKTISSEYTNGTAEIGDSSPTIPMWLRSVTCDSNVTDINACTRKTFLEVSDYCQLGEVAAAICS